MAQKQPQASPARFVVIAPDHLVLVRPNFGIVEPDIRQGAQQADGGKFLFDGPERAKRTDLLAYGAGGLKAVSGFSAADHLKTMAEAVSAWAERITS